MTEKRFRYDGVDIEDNVEMVEYAICTSEGGSKVTGLLNELNDENEQLKTELKGMEELLNSYRKTIKHDAELLADATKNGYLPPIKGGDFE